MKRKLVWRFYNLTQPTPVEIIQVQTRIKGFSAAVCATTYLQVNANYGALALVIAGVVDFFITGFGYEEEKSPS